MLSWLNFCVNHFIFNFILTNVQRMSVCNKYESANHNNEFLKETCHFYDNMHITIIKWWSQARVVKFLLCVVLENLIYSQLVRVKHPLRVLSMSLNLIFIYTLSLHYIYIITEIISMNDANFQKKKKKNRKYVRLHPFVNIPVIW